MPSRATFPPANPEQEVFVLRVTFLIACGVLAGTIATITAYIIWSFQ